MKAPNLRSLSESCPVPETVHWRASPPSARGGKVCEPSISLSASITWLILRSLISLTAREVAPEIAQQVAPFEFVVGDAVELVLEAGGEIVFDVAREKILQERDH